MVDAFKGVAANRAIEPMLMAVLKRAVVSTVYEVPSPLLVVP